ncbi:Alpha-type protein kinase domain-containing protein [Mycena sanguinolenta]|uniref:Alpha-type protein kinase domain-containing protein n=1 Tax=Mycena sanguinolenta TaxID=230812 RepID=A0A8H7CTA3_9AGAR|nr:Alpha-type protein kinase domain-containing protein [Mycena sanguinolenta]
MCILRSGSNSFNFRRHRSTSFLGSDDAEITQFFTCDLARALQGSIIVEFSTNLGIGTFKSAHRGRLTLTHLPAQGLGTTPNELVAVKRMYRRRSNNVAAEKSVVTRYTPTDEYAKTVEEANLLYWASSLMEFTYSAIDHFLSEASTHPPFEIPQLRFVRAGVAVCHDQVTGSNINNSSSIKRTYLVEEFIEGGSDTFVKFVHNGDANPLLDAGEELYHIAEFLCFTQHLQYFKTDGAVFLSDLQGTSDFIPPMYSLTDSRGSATLLTDPQIMTSSYDFFLLFCTGCL